LFWVENFNRISIQCKELGLVEPDTVTKALTDKAHAGSGAVYICRDWRLVEIFVFYGKMPKSRWKDVEKAEKNTPEGNKIFAELKEDYAENYLTSIWIINKMRCS
jgi:hypothetical protein